MRRMTAAEAREFRARWRRVAAADTAELRRSSVETRFRQLAALMASSDVLGSAARLAAEDRAVLRRWAKLRRALGA